MAFPSYAASATWRNTASATSHSITMPSGISSGDLLLCVFSSDGAPTCTPSAGWATLGQESYSTGVTGAVFWRVAAGSDTLTIETSTSELCSAITARITGARSIAGAASNGSSTNSDPPALAPFAGPADVLWIATRSGDSTGVATAAPSGFGNLETRAGYNTSSASTNIARLASSAASIDPGTFTSATEQWVAWTLAIWDGGQQCIASSSGPMGEPQAFCRAVDGLKASAAGPLGSPAASAVQPTCLLLSVAGPLGPPTVRARMRGKPVPSASQVTAASAQMLLSDPLPLRRSITIPGYAIDELLPWVYGRARIAPIKLTTDGLLWLLADHAIIGVEEVRDGASVIQGWQVLTVRDSAGHTTSRLRLTQAPTGDIGVSVVGKSHRVTGALLDHPADIAEDILAVCGWEIGSDAFRPWRARWPGVQIGGSFGERSTIREAITEIAATIGADWAGSPIRGWAGDPGTSVGTIDARIGADAVASASHDGLATVLRVAYDYDAAAGQMRAAITVRAPDRISQIGEISADLDLPWVRTARDAYEIATAELQRSARPLWSYTIQVPASAVYAPGQTVAIDLPWVPSGDAIITRVSRSRGAQSISAERRAGPVPRGESV